jgi:hypothetical protein
LNTLSSISSTPPAALPTDAIAAQTRELDVLLQSHVELCDLLGEQFYNLDAQLSQIERSRSQARRSAIAADQE